MPRILCELARSSPNAGTAASCMVRLDRARARIFASDGVVSELDGGRSLCAWARRCGGSGLHEVRRLERGECFPGIERWRKMKELEVQRVRRRSLLLDNSQATGDFERAGSLCRGSLALFQEIGDRRGMGGLLVSWIPDYDRKFIGGAPVARGSPGTLQGGRKQADHQLVTPLVRTRGCIFYQGEHSRGLLLAEEALPSSEAGPFQWKASCSRIRRDMVFPLTMKASLLSSSGACRGLGDKMSEYDVLDSRVLLPFNRGVTAPAGFTH